MKKLILLIVLILICYYNFAEITITATVDKNVISLDEQINLQVTVSGNVTTLPNPKLPDLSDFQVYSSGRSQNISIINGQITSSIVFNYVLSPRKVGEFTINPITIEYQGKIYQTQPIQIKVEKTIQQKSLPTEKDVYRGTKKDIFVETFVDKHTVYVNEQITLTFRFYTKINLLSQPQYSPADTTGFVKEDLPPQRNFYTIINGERYYVSEIKTALFPVSSGKYVIGPAVVKCVIEDFDIDRFFSDSFFRRFFSQGKELVLKSNPIEITVLPLPQPQPQDFSGSVGKFVITSSLDTNKLEVNNTTMLNVKISGLGNIKSVSLPKQMIQKILGQEFVVFDPIISYDIKKENYKVSGTKIIKFPISATSPGQKILPGIRFVYFNPETRSYETAVSKPLILEVTPSKTSLAQGKKFSIDYQQKKSDKSIPFKLEDIRYIKTNLNIVKHNTISTSVLIILQILPLLSWLSFSSYKIYSKSRSKDVKKLKFVFAFKNFKKNIRKLKSNAGKLEPKNIMNSLYTLLLEYLNDKLSLTSDKVTITIDSVKEFLEIKNVSSIVINEFITLWDEINFYKFSPATVENIDLKELITKTENIVTKLEYELQKM